MIENPASPSKLRAGVMGWPINHSLSPRLHQFWLQKHGIAGRYDALPVEPTQLGTALRTISAQGLRGVNLTVPHKEAACAIVDTLDPTAQRIGAANLIVAAADGTLQGRNTDAFGFAQNLLCSGFNPATGTAIIIGAGGASRAVLVALQDMGFPQIFITNRTAERAEKLALEFTTPECVVIALEQQDIPDALRDAQLLVNTTSLGMTGQPPLDIALDTLPQTATVTDIVYAPLETGLLRHARERGHKTIDGLGMLLHQARPSFTAFFGSDPEVTPELRAFVFEKR